MGFSTHAASMHGLRKPVPRSTRLASPMQLLENEFARRNGTQIELRSAPLRLAWPLTSLVSSDGHSLTATFSCSFSPLDSPTERRMLEEVFLADKPAATADDIFRYFAPALQSAAARSASTKSASDWFSNHSDSPLLHALLETTKSLAFTAGLEVLPPHRLDIDSPTLARQQREAHDRQFTEERAAHQVQHLQRLSALQREFDSFRA